MQKKSMVNIAVLGGGYMGQNHVRVLTTLGNVNLLAICDKEPKKAEKLANQYKLKPYADFRKLLETEELNAVSICLPTSLHFQAGYLAIKKGLHTFMEKPITSKIDEAKKLINYSKKQKLKIMVGHIERFNPVVNEIKQRIKYGELGKVLKVHTQRFSPPTGRATDVSAAIDLATHDIDIIRYLLDEEPIRIYAETDKRAHTKEDLMSALLRFKSGIIGLVEVSWLHPAKVRNLTILGQNGMYVADYITQELFFYRQNQNLFETNPFYLSNLAHADVVKIAFQAKEPLLIELEHFTNSLRTNSKMPVTGEDGLTALMLAEKMIRSGESNKVLK